MNQFFSSLTDTRWQHAIEQRVQSEVIESLSKFLTEQLLAGKTIYPDREHWFRALNATALGDVKVVILGQDPYHGPKQAQGLSFSVPEQMKLPPSLRNIFKEQKTDLGLENTSGDLTRWSKQGVLLLNAVLTVEASKAGSHAKRGWERITDAAIEAVSDEGRDVVFLLWGAYAQKKSALIDQSKHLILAAPHPSPLSAHQGWFGCQHFSKTNEFLKSRGKALIDWATSDQKQLPLV